MCVCVNVSVSAAWKDTVNSMQIIIINEDFFYTGRPVEHKASCVTGQTKAQVQRRRRVEHPGKVIAAAQASSQPFQSCSFLPDPLRSRLVASLPSLFSNRKAASRVSTPGGGWISSVNRWHPRSAKQLMRTHKHTLSSGRGFSSPPMGWMRRQRAVLS